MVFLDTELSVAIDVPFQDAASQIMEKIIFFHDQIMFILTIIVTIVL